MKYVCYIERDSLIVGSDTFGPSTSWCCSQFQCCGSHALQSFSTFCQPLAGQCHPPRSFHGGRLSSRYTQNDKVQCGSRRDSYINRSVPSRMDYLPVLCAVVRFECAGYFLVSCSVLRFAWRGRCSPEESVFYTDWPVERLCRTFVLTEFCPPKPPCNYRSH